jgi:hypothetical protein
MQLTGCVIHTALLVLIGLPFAFSLSDRALSENIAKSYLIGFVIESLTVFVLAVTVANLFLAVAIFYAAGLPLCLWYLIRTCVISRPISFRPKVHEMFACAMIAEKLCFSTVLIINTPLLFDDPLQHWAGRAKLLFENVNWSWNPASPDFLGCFGAKNYPLGLPIHRAINAMMGGGWSDLAGRFDGLPLFLAMLAILWPAFIRLSGNRVTASAGAFIVSAIPFQPWLISSGNADLAIQVFAGSGAAALLSGEFFLAGLMAAGAAFIKHDGMIIVFPVLLITSLPLLSWGSGIRNVYSELSRFLAGFSVITPWIIFQILYRIPSTPFETRFNWHPGSLKILWEKIIGGGTHGIFWPGCLILLFIGFFRLVRNRAGFALLAGWVTWIGTIVFIFSATKAYSFLVSGETIYRSLAQTYGFTVLMIMSALRCQNKSSIKTREWM